MDGKQPCCSSGTIFPGGGILVFKITLRRSCSPNSSTLRSGNVVLITDPIEQLDPSHQGSDNEPKAQSPGARRRRPFSVASHEQLQPAFPQERDLTPHHHTNSRRLRPPPGMEGQNTLEVSLLLNAVLTSHNQTSLTKGLTHPCSKVLLLRGS